MHFKRLAIIGVLTVVGGLLGSLAGRALAGYKYPGWDAPKFESDARIVEVGHRVVLVSSVCAAIAVPISLARWLGLRFSLRVLFTVVTIAVLLLVFMFHQLNWIRHRTEYLETAKYVHDGRQSNWGLWIFGEDGVASLTIGPFAENPDPAYARALFPEAEIVDLSADFDRE